jgi:hypothetical protein
MIGREPVQIDFLTSVPGLEFPSSWRRRNSVDVEGVIVQFLSRRDLEIAKRTSGRPTDLADLDEMRRHAAGGEQ